MVNSEKRSDVVSERIRSLTSFDFPHLALQHLAESVGPGRDPPSNNFLIFIAEELIETC